MYQYYIIEIKKTAGEYEHTIDWAWDENQDLARRKAESKAYKLLETAALSQTSIHSVTVISDQGFVVMSKCYQNIPETVNTPAEPSAE